MKTKFLPCQSQTFCTVASLFAFLLISLFRAEAASPVTDANWMSMGGIPGTDGDVFAAVVDGSGNLYIGGKFTIAGDVPATNIAKWNGTRWSALGGGGYLAAV